tara:strand:- start:2001 stop:2846 length:846 start_codon:yes stop_codon:yes gene_type:complete
MSTTPGPDLKEMVGPGQEDLIDNFLEEVEQEQASLETPQQEEKTLYADKFDSTEKLEEAYLELQRKLGEKGGEEKAPEPESYTAEQAAGLYGQEAVDALAEKGINLADVMFKADQGEDISEHFDALAEGFGVTRKMVENHVANAQAANKAATPDAPIKGLTESDIATLKQSIGGEEAFAELSKWMESNLSEKELEGYNKAVDSTPEVAEFALQQMKARADGAKEPTLISGGSAAPGDVFDSDRQALDARNKRDANGNFEYEVNPKYRSWYERTLARSDVFG